MRVHHLSYIVTISQQSSRRWITILGAGVVTLFSVFLGNTAEAQPCPAYTYPMFSSGTNAVGAQVTSNFNTVWNCINTLQSGGTFTKFEATPGATTTINSTNFSGSTALSRNGSGTSTIGSTYVQDWAQIGLSAVSSYIGNNFTNIGLFAFGEGTNTAQGAIGGLFGANDAGSGNAYGVYIRGVNSASGNTYGIYQAGGSNNYFAGNIGIGTSSPAVTLQVVGDIRTGISGTNGCVQNFAGTALAGTCSSDERLKTVTGKIAGILDRLTSLDLVTFHWNSSAARLYHNSTKTNNTGFLAQSVEKVFPELVSTDAKGYKQLDYSTLQLYGLEAIKELKASSDNQASELAALRDENGSLRRQVSELIAQVRSDDARLTALEAAFATHKTADNTVVTRAVNVNGQ